MARATTERFPTRAVDRPEPVAHLSSRLLLLATVGLTALLMGNALLATPARSDVVALPAETEVTAPRAAVSATPTVAPASSGAPAVGQTIDAAGTLVSVPAITAGRTLVRLGADVRLLAAILTGLLLAIVGRRPLGRGPVLLREPVAAAPGLGPLRRGPPLR